MDEATAAAPSVPAVGPLEPYRETDAHIEHRECEAQSSLGSIWLHWDWREKQSRELVMEFMALSGTKDHERPGQWTITSLMLLQRMEKNRQFWTSERVQIMGCNIKQHLWIQVRPQTMHRKLD